MGTPLSRTVSDGGGYFPHMPFIRGRSQTASDVSSTRLKEAEETAKLAEKVMDAFLAKVKVEMIPQEIFRGSIPSKERENFSTSFKIQDEKSISKHLKKANLLTLSSFIKVVLIQVKEGYMQPGELLSGGFTPYVFDDEDIRLKFFPFMTILSQVLKEIVDRSKDLPSPLTLRSLSLASGENFSKMLYPLGLFPEEALPKEDLQSIALLRINSLTK